MYVYLSCLLTNKPLLNIGLWILNLAHIGGIVPVCGTSMMVVLGKTRQKGSASDVMWGSASDVGVSHGETAEYRVIGSINMCNDM